MDNSVRSARSKVFGTVASYHCPVGFMRSSLITPSSLNVTFAPFGTCVSSRVANAGLLAAPLMVGCRINVINNTGKMTSRIVWSHLPQTEPKLPLRRGSHLEVFIKRPLQHHHVSLAAAGLCHHALRQCSSTRNQLPRRMERL